MTISWYSISIPLNGSVIFNGYFNVDNTTNVIQNFYYVNNNQYVDILLRNLGENDSDNLFINNNFTNGGVNILSVIPYINNTYNNPYKHIGQYLIRYVVVYIFIYVFMFFSEKTPVQGRGCFIYEWNTCSGGISTE